ncbi:tRNA-uridine aminocarboxypropyltransferase [Caerostris extrusa]|uniref:tRNA-uridine aminocarboxypropyltransferase n=1 Tax=Caerostris extrusa TaxID=172846 RepID=A0AAV4QWY4_CAEEX|nr:tRNA-uridine aminocarboxypropyltransferase [Caerostris extrusa]
MAVSEMRGLISPKPALHRAFVVQVSVLAILQEKLDTHLSTIEAIYYFLVELHGLMHPEVPYDGEYDNMLFFFKFMYFKIRTLYDPLKLKAYRNGDPES